MAIQGAEKPVSENHDVVIVGGGPVGLFTGLCLAQKGIEVLVVEAEADIGTSPRALGYFPIVLKEFERAGILDQILEEGYANRDGITFRTPASGTNEILAKLPPAKTSGSSIDYVLHLGQPKVAEIVRRNALKIPSFSIRYQTSFVGVVENSDDFVTIETSNASGERQQLTSRFVIACDGASSPVRKALGIPFEGYTWDDWRFLAINVKYDFAKDGYSAASHVIDPEDWAVIVRAGPVEENLWRVATGIRADVPIEDIEKHVPAKLERLLPGPRPLDYELVAVSPYWAHERVASTFRSGRIMLAGDAAHANNPLTAMGLSTGFTDVGVISRLLPQAFTPERASSWPHLLDKYATLRRNDFVNRVQKITRDGKLRIHSTDPKIVAEREDFFRMLNKNPGFGLFVAGTMMDVLPDDLEPPIWTRSIAAIVNVWTTITIIARIIFWKIRASRP